MTYEEFKKELYRNLQLQDKIQGGQVVLLEKGSIFLDRDMVSLVQLVNLANYGKEDNVIREDTICVVWKQEETQGLLHWSVREVYLRFKEEGWQGILPEMISKIQGTRERGRGFHIENYMPENDRLILKPLYYPYLREELEDSICWIIGDIALTVYFLICNTGEEMLTMKLNRDILGRRAVTDEVILTNALLNTCVKMPPKIYYDRRIRAYRVTSRKRGDGAVALFYPGIKEQLAGMVGGDFYVGFPSVHEALVYPVYHNALSKLKAHIYHTGIFCEPREKLTDHVYRYSSRRKELMEV